MRVTSSGKIFLCAAVVLFTLIGHAFAEGLNNNEVEFTGTISSVVVNGEGVGTLFIHFDTFDLRVMVNSNTELENQAGEDIEISDLAAGNAVKIKGKFSSSGVLASEIRVLANPDNHFQLRGRITNVQTSGGNTLISLLGITIVVNSDTKIEADGARVPASDLKTGMFVRAEGTISGNTWTATLIKILSEVKKKDQVRFEGTVHAVTSGMIQVEVEGVPGAVTTVLLTPNTRIVGELAKGVLVEVKGTLNTDLSVTAKEVRVLQAFEIKPDDRKLKVGESAGFIVKLRETAASDVKVSLTSSDPSVVAISPNSVTIPKGSKTAAFSATGLKVGSAVITAEALGQKAAARVKVGEVAEEENEKPAGDVRIAFAPDKIKMPPNDKRDVVLLIKPPQKSPVMVTFKVKNGLVSVDAASDFSSGAAALKVTIKSGSKEGTDSVIAKFGGATAELLVEVSSKKEEENEQEKAEIEFRPDEIKLGVGETRGVSLVSNRSFDNDVVVSISSGGTVAEVPSKAVLKKDTKSVLVSVKGLAEGKVNLIAALPAELGGDTAKLEVEVKNRIEQEKAEIQFRPDEIKLLVGETRSVSLVSNRTFDKNVDVAISGDGTVAQAPSKVTILAGTNSVLVPVAGKAEGKVNLIATLPSDLGGRTAKLEVEVKNQ